MGHACNILEHLKRYTGNPDTESAASGLYKAVEGLFIVGMRLLRRVAGFVAKLFSDIAGMLEVLGQWVLGTLSQAAEVAKSFFRKAVKFANDNAVRLLGLAVMGIVAAVEKLLSREIWNGSISGLLLSVGAFELEISFEEHEFEALNLSLMSIAVKVEMPLVGNQIDIAVYISLVPHMLDGVAESVEGFLEKLYQLLTDQGEEGSESKHIGIASAEDMQRSGAVGWAALLFSVHSVADAFLEIAASWLTTFSTGKFIVASIAYILSVAGLVSARSSQATEQRTRC